MEYKNVCDSLPKILGEQESEELSDKLYLHDCASIISTAMYHIDYLTNNSELFTNVSEANIKEQLIEIQNRVVSGEITVDEAFEEIKGILSKYQKNQ